MRDFQENKEFALNALARFIDEHHDEEDFDINFTFPIRTQLESELGLNLKQAEQFENILAEQLKSDMKKAISEKKGGTLIREINSLTAYVDAWQQYCRRLKESKD